jgi:hypothetical protein
VPERLLEGGLHLRPRLRAPAAYARHTKNAIDAEPRVREMISGRAPQDVAVGAGHL